MEIFFEFVKKHMWLVEIIVGVAFLVLIYFCVKYFLKFLKNRAKIKKYSWENKIDYIALKPFYVLIWFIGIFYVLDILFTKFGIEEFLKYNRAFRNTFLVFVISWFIFRWKNAAVDALLASKKRKMLDKAKLHLMSKLLSIVIFFIAFLIILQVLGINIMPLIAFGGVGAAAIGFAAKDVIANFFGGLMIYVTRPFTKGDFVEIPEKSILGTVENIGWYLTCIHDLDHCPIYIPNSVFSTAQMKNKSRRFHRKIEETISVRYDDFEMLKDIIFDVKKIFREEEKVDNEIEPLVCFTTFNEYSLDIFARAYTFVISYSEFMEVKERVLLKVKEAIQKRGADIPFPTSVVDLKK